MAFRTKLDSSNNRQIIQRENTITSYSGRTDFGVPYTGLTGGADLANTQVLYELTGITSTFSGNLTTTIFNFGTFEMNGGEAYLNVITPSNQNDDQIVDEPFFNGVNPSVNPFTLQTVYDYYTGSTFDITITNFEEVSPSAFTGTLYTELVTVYSATTNDYFGDGVWANVEGTLKTNEIIVVNNAIPAHVLICQDTSGRAIWQSASALTTPNVFTTGSSATNYSIKAVNPTGLDATGDYAVAIGNNTKAFGNASFASGINSIAYANYSHAEGGTTIASGDSSHAEGGGTIAVGTYSHAEGRSTIASGFSSHAEGHTTIANGLASHAGGVENTAHSFGETSIGLYSTNYTGASTTTYNALDRIFNVGNGTTNLLRSDAFTILKNGSIYAPSLDITKINNIGAKSLINKEFVDDKLLLKQNLPTGHITGMTLSINPFDNTKVDIGPGAYSVTNYNDLNNIDVNIIILPLGITGITPSFLTNTGISATYIGLDINQNVIQQASPFDNSQRRTIAPIGIAVHSNHVNVNVTNESKSSIIAPTNQLHDFIKAVGFLNLSGNIFGPANPTVDMSMTKTAGQIWGLGINGDDFLDPHRLSLSGQSLVTFRIRKSNGVETVDKTGLTSSDLVWEDTTTSALTLTTIASNRFGIFHGTLFQSGLTRLQYPQRFYTSLAEALANVDKESYITEQNISDNGIFRFYLVIQGTTTNFNDSTRFQFVSASKFGSVIGAGGVSMTFDNITSGLGYIPENVANKQNSLAVDGTGQKYPTVDAVNSGFTLNASQLEKLNEGNGDGWRIRGRNAANFGNIGLGAFDFSYSISASSTLGATGSYSFAEGTGTTANGFASHAEGRNTITMGENSHAEGHDSEANGTNSHAEGYNTTANGFASHAEGNGTQANGLGSHSEGSQTIASAQDSHAEGNSTIASGTFSHAEGSITTASGSASHAEGVNTVAGGLYSHAEGQNTSAFGESSHAEGRDTVANVEYSHAEGYGSIANGYASHAEGYFTESMSDASHAEGDNTLASGFGSHAEGGNTVADGLYSHAEGSGTQASGSSAHAEGSGTQASGDYSHAGGSGTIASGNVSFNHSNSSGGVSNVMANYSAILGGTNNIITSAATNSVILGGSNLTGSSSNTVYVPTLNINNVGAGPSTVDIGVDANGNVVNVASDIRLKENINTIDNALEKILNLRGVTYNWRDRENGTDAIRIGFIAQEVKEVVPELVYKCSNNDFYGVHYSNTVALLVEAIKELATNGVKTTLETQVIKAEDNNIELNYNGTHETAIGGGILVLKGVDEETDSSFYTDSDGDWVFSPNIKLPYYTPSGTNDPKGNVGNICYDDNYQYIKTKSGWKRTPLNNF